MAIPAMLKPCCANPSIVRQTMLSGEIMAICQTCGYVHGPAVNQTAGSQAMMSGPPASKYKYYYPAPGLIYSAWHDDPMSPPPPPPKLDIARIDQLSGVEARKVKPKIVVPDLTACIIGWRGWRVTVSGNEYRLQGLGMDTAWEPKKPVVATCQKDRSAVSLMLSAAWGDPEAPKPHYCPGKECTCGVWAFRTLDEFKKMAEQYHSCVVVGEVYLWGRVLECENGYRAQYGYPKELWCLKQEHESLSYIYNVAHSHARRKVNVPRHDNQTLQTSFEQSTFCVQGVPH